MASLKVIMRIRRGAILMYAKLVTHNKDVKLQRMQSNASAPVSTSEEGQLKLTPN